MFQAGILKKLNKTKAELIKKESTEYIWDMAQDSNYFISVLRAKFLENGKCQILHKSIFPHFSQLQFEYRKKKKNRHNKHIRSSI